MAQYNFDFEQPIVELRRQLEELRAGENPTEERVAAIAELEGRLERTQREIYGNLTVWQRIQVARHQARPHALDYIRRLIRDWTELHGDRAFGDDHACLAGLGLLGEQPVAVIAQQKGSDLKENVFYNYGSMHPEGYRKALRVMKLAEKFGRPIVTLIDTGGAFPGIGAEERGQGEAIARNIMEMSLLRVPIICVVLGEGGSGGALGIGIGDRLLMQENAWYSVISPEGCASILWRDAKFAPKAAEALKLAAPDLKEVGVVDEIVTEPLGGAHQDPAAAAATLGEALERHLRELAAMDVETLLEARFQKYRQMGVYDEDRSAETEESPESPESPETSQ